MTKIKAVFIDFDGTLADEQKHVSETDRNTLEQLGKLRIVRILATGRSMYAVNLVIEDDFPIDYVVFSSGSGVYDFKQKKLLHSRSIESKDVMRLANVLTTSDIDFKLIKPIPNNHQFAYYPSSKPIADIQVRIAIYKAFELPPVAPSEFGDAGQVLAVLRDADVLKRLEADQPNLSLVRATSPLDGTSVWAEFFAEGVNKGYGANYVCNMLKIKPSETVAVGNDFNDIPLLEFTPNAYVVANADSSLTEKYHVVPKNTENGVTYAINKHINGLRNE